MLSYYNSIIFKSKSIKNIITILSAILFTSCNPHLQTLPDRYTTISTKEKTYKHINLFNPDILKIVDTNSIYKECCYVQNLDSSSLGLNESKKYKLITYPKQRSSEYLRFYSDGYCNSFINSKVGETYSATDFNPEITGFRGVYFQDKKGRLLIDLFTQTSGSGSFSNLKLYLKVSGDTLFVKTVTDYNSYQIFIKKEIPEEVKDIKGWKK